jgi:hypothetical protein
MSELDRLRTPQPWKLLLVGGCTLVTLIVLTSITGELPDGWWFVAMVTLLFSLLTISAGVVLGAAQLFDGRTTRS